MDAQGALDSFLGRLTTVLVNEAQLLGGLRGDVEFIKDEMESMNGLLLHLTEAQHRDHQVRAWMRQVVGLTGDCKGNVELYVHYVGSRPGDDGFLGYLRRILRFVRTIPVRHRIATWIQELKVRARDVGDRRQRYGVTVPASAKADMNAVDGEPSDGEEDLRRRAVLDADEPPTDAEVKRSAIETIKKCLSEAREDGVSQPHQVMVFCISGRDLVVQIADGVYSVQDQSVCKAWSYETDSKKILADILEQVAGGDLSNPPQSPFKKKKKKVALASTTVDEDMEKQFISKIHGYLKGKRFLIVIDHGFTPNSYGQWKRLQDALLQAADGCLPGSSIIMTTEDDYLAIRTTEDDHLACLSSPYRILINAKDHQLELIYSANALELNADYIWHIIQKEDFQKTSAFARKMLLHLLYVKPTITEDELKMYRDAIKVGMSLHKSVDHTMVRLCYNELPIKYRSCLLHLTNFPEGHIFRTTGLARRWIAEDLVTISTTSDERQSEADQVGQYWDVLFIRGFISPVEISEAGNIKSFTVKDEVHKVISKIAREVNIVDTNLPVELARHLSIHNRIVLPKSHSAGESIGIAASLPSLAESPQWQLLKVLDLEGCHGLKEQHLKSICNILLLKYLSLRNTDVTELPKQIKELQWLETLDVRETKVQALAKKAIVLPLLKHFLAAHKVSAANDATTSEYPFSAVEMPLCIEKMNNMEILSHVRISNNKELDGIAELLKLRKLGVALQGNQTKLSELFSQIEKLHRCLRSLSIRFDPKDGSDVGMLDPLHSTPQFIERLNISGITSGLRHLIQEHHKLTRITLCMTHLMEDDLTILGKLRALWCLRLQHNSYTTECEIGFMGEAFQSLDYLLVQGKDITKISFASGAAPNLERIVWCFARMDAISGLNHLSKLKKLELNGDCDLDPIKQELLRHDNLPSLKHNPYHQRQEDRSAAPTSSSSAP